VQPRSFVLLVERSEGSAQPVRSQR
jgi:hypothetical protein